MKRFGLSLTYLLSLHVIALAAFFVFRLCVYMTAPYEFPDDMTLPVKAVAFVKGLWFDNVIACYVTVIPLLIMVVANMFKTIGKSVFMTCASVASVLYTVCFIIAGANIPYFGYFFNNINSSIFNWFGYGGTTGGMIFQESSYYFPILLTVAMIVGYWLVSAKLSRKFYKLTSIFTPPCRNLLYYSGVPVIGAACIGLCLFGIRGRVGYNPIKVSQAYYCRDPFLNQLGVNPVFNLLTSWLDDMRKENRPIALLADDEAIANVRRLLGRETDNDVSPIAMQVLPDDSVANRRKNVVIILMESMSANLMKSFGQEKELTPFLDSLSERSRFYRNCYSSGLHTNHGIYATLYSFPTILKRNAMKGTRIPVYSGLPTVLAENGYHNMFFMTHESQYDNMNAFLRTNGFHKIHSQENYPKEKVVNSFGVSDDFLFSYALERINAQAASGQPFMSVLLTISNHPPYIVPEYFNPQNREPHDAIVEYADNSIRRFMDEARQQPWWENTLFVLLGDHGKLVGNPECEMPQCHNHIPLMIYGNGIAPETIDSYCGQIDVAPTLLGMLGIGYVRNNFGVDVEKESRPCIFYTNDKHIAARDSSRLYIYDPSESLRYYYRLSDAGMKAAQCDSVFAEMEKYCFSMLQAAQSLAKEGLTVDSPSKR